MVTYEIDEQLKEVRFIGTGDVIRGRNERAFLEMENWDVEALRARRRWAEEDKDPWRMAWLIARDELLERGLIEG